MHRFINVMVLVFVLFTCAIGAGAQPPSAQIASTAPLPMLLTTVGQTQVILHDMQPANHRLVLEIRSPDVTSMPSRSELRLAFDTRVAEVTEPRAPMPLRLETAVADRQVTFFLARDPFAFPQPWSYTVTIAFNQLPRTGAVTLGNLPSQNVTYPSPAPVVQALPGT